MAGIDADGFTAKTLEDIQTAIEGDQRALVSAGLNTSSASPIGQVNGIVASKVREVWELAQAVYNSFFASQAEGYALTLRSALTGTVRSAATYSTVAATVNVEPGTYAIGSLIASVDGSPTSRFSNSTEVVNAGAVAANVAATFTCETTGPVRANAGTLTVIAQAVTGWNSITNAADATLGAEEETDEALRIRREQELRAQGSTTVNAILADLLRDVDGVVSVSILENDTGTTDGNGVPAHSIECIVYGPASPTSADNQAVAEVIFGSKAAGIGTYGTTTKTVVDDQGTSHSVKLTRPTTLDAYVELTIEVDADTYAGDTAVKEAVAAAADGLGPGDILDWRRVVGLPYSVSGVTRVTAFGMSTSGGGPFTETSITPTIRQIVTISTANVAVTVA